MKKVILKLLVVSLFFQGQISSASTLSLEIQQYNQEMTASENIGAMSAEQYDQLMEANEYEGEAPLTEEELIQLQNDLTEQNLQPAQTDDDVEDISGINSVAELQNAAIARTKRVKGIWGNHFVYISKKDGTRTSLTAQNINTSLTPASTLKVFSGYLAYLNKSYANKDLSYMLHVSSNPGADAALKSVSGTINKSVATLKKTFSGLSDINKLVMVDGSGLSRSNKVTARLLTSLLEKIYKSDNYNTFKHFMAQPGEYGTMRSQLNDVDQQIGDVYAKTGTLPRGMVKGLTGYVESDKGIIIFSSIANKVNHASAKIAMQDLVRMHAKYLKSKGLL